MSKETLEWLNSNTLIGHTDKRGAAWHYRESLQGGVSNHFEGAVPVEAVRSRLFHWQALETPLCTMAPATFDDMTGLDPEGNPVALRVVDGRKAITRSDTGAVLGVFKAGYQPHQPEEWLLENVQTLVGGSLDIGSAGLLKGGAVAWLQVERDENVMTPSGVEFRPFITASTSFDGSLSTTYQAGCTLVVCDNTLAASLLERSSSVKVKHTRYSHLDAAAVRDALGIVEQAAETFAADVETLTNWRVTATEWGRFLDAVCPVDADAKTTRSATLSTKKRDELQTLYANDLRVTPWAGTAFGVLQATNTWAHHVQTVRGTNRVERNTLNAINGSTAKADAATIDTLTRICARV